MDSMEKLDKVINGVIQSRNTMSSNLPILLQKQSASVAEISKIVLWAEVASQIKPLTDQQRQALVVLLEPHGFTVNELKERARSVLLQDTFGTIEYKYWVSDLICTRDEAKAMAESIIEQRKKQWLAFNPDEYFNEDALIRQGFISVEYYLGKKTMELIGDVKDLIIDEVKKHLREKIK